MARQDALSIKLTDGTTPADLMEQYAGLIENIEATAVSIQLKNYNLSGDPMGGSVEAKRFENSVSVAYGTARTAGAGVDVQTEPVVINLNVDREIVEEIEAKDIKLYGIPAMLQRRAQNHKSAMKRELDTAFFTEAYVTGTATTCAGATWDIKLEELAVALETTSNTYVDGVDRSMMAFVVTPSVHSLLRLQIDAMPATDNAYAKGAVGLYHGVPIWVSNHLPKGVGQVVNAFVMAFGSVAQPVAISQPYTDERIPLSNSHAVELFYNYGTKAVTPDLIRYVGDTYSAS